MRTDTLRSAPSVRLFHAATLETTSKAKLALRGAAAVLAVAGVVGWATGWFQQPPAANGAPQITLETAASSRDELIGQFLAALSANDREAIERLRINESEYLDLVLPGSVQRGKPPQIMPEKKSVFFWHYLDTRSRYFLRALTRRFAGKPLELTSVEVQKVEPLLWYTVHRDPILHVKYEDKILDIHIGSIAEIDGQFKFISYYTDD